MAEVNKLNKKDRAYVENLNAGLTEGLNAINQSLESAKFPFQALGEVVVRLENSGKNEMVDTVLAFNKTVASDVDHYQNEYDKLKKQVDVLITESPMVGRHIGRHAAKAMAVGQQILSLNADVIQTAVNLSNDFNRFIKEAGME